MGTGTFSNDLCQSFGMILWQIQCFELIAGSFILPHNQYHFSFSQRINVEKKQLLIPLGILIVTTCAIKSVEILAANHTPEGGEKSHKNHQIFQRKPQKFRQQQKLVQPTFFFVFSRICCWVGLCLVNLGGAKNLLLLVENVLLVFVDFIFVLVKSVFGLVDESFLFWLFFICLLVLVKNFFLVLVEPLDSVQHLISLHLHHNTHRNQNIFDQNQRNV